MNLITLGLGGALLVTLGLASGDVVIPDVQAAIPGGAIAAERGTRAPQISTGERSNVSTGRRSNTQTSRRRN